MANVTVTIDGRSIEVPKEYTVMMAANELGIKIPALCYDKSLEIVSACRLCIVEIEGRNKFETACSYKVRDGMVVNTETEALNEIRRDILQLLLDSHPNDCLTCDKAGECLLQEYAYKYGVEFRDHSGDKRPIIEDETSPYIIKDNSKCILCGKCIRTCSQVKIEREVLSFAERGYETKVVLDRDQTFAESSCVSCNRCVTVCPVGALIDRRQSGKGRTWETKKRVVNCNVCSYGCEFEVLSRNGNNVAVRALPPSTDRPLCLKGRLTTELKYLDNPETPYRKIGDEFKEDTWDKVLGLTEIIDKINRLEEDK